MSHIITIRKQGCSELGLNVGRYAGGPLYVEGVTPGGVAERCGVPIGWSLVRVGAFNVYNVRTLLDALDGVSRDETFEVALGQDMTEKIAEMQLQAKTQKGLLKRTLSLEGFTAASGVLRRLGSRRTSSRKTPSSCAASSEDDQAGSDPSSPLLPISFMEHDLDDGAKSTYLPPPLVMEN